MVDIVCAQCGSAYQAQRKSRLFCSRSCMDKARYARKPKKERKTFASIYCAHCLQPFVPLRRLHRFCSDLCRMRLDNEKNRARNNEKTKKWMQRDRTKNPERTNKINARYRAKPENKLHAALKSRCWHAGNREHANPRRIMRKQKQRNQKPWTVLVNAAKARAKNKTLLFDLTDDWAFARWTGRCELTNLPFVIGIRGQGGKLFSPSIDKIDPAKGYVQNNCRFILHCVNIFKYTGTDENMYAVAEALLAQKTLMPRSSTLIEAALSLPG